MEFSGATYCAFPEIFNPANFASPADAPALGAGGRLDKQIGPTVTFVESGTLVFVSDQPVAITGGSARPSAIPGPSGKQETVVVGGQTVSIAEDTVFGLRNDGRDPAVFLALFMFSPERETEAMGQAEATATAGGLRAEPKGLSQQPLGVTYASFPVGPGVVTIERVELAAGRGELTNLAGGAVVGGVERGSVIIALDTGRCFIWPGILRVRDVRSFDLGPGQSRELAADDGFGCWDSGIQWRAGAAGAMILRMRVEPAGVSTGATPIP